ncbi:MAG: LysM peptidoglycan-binding domain-containing protein [Chitinophagales bacterium]|nr:LysM peptidoglycan-binding domain-containing protein [Chitinophagales bacterium]
MMITTRNIGILYSFSVFTFFFLLAKSVFAQTYDEMVEHYIDQYKDIAIEEMWRTGIPASITLAQGIIESNAGKSPLAIDANNHFGIKCHDTWTGESYSHDDDRKNECFRKYFSSLDSYKDHSDFIKNRGRYSVLFTYNINDYKAWAKGLKACGYATNPHYAILLIKCIDDYDLHQWDLKEDERNVWFASLNNAALKSEIKETGNPEVVNASPSSCNAEERIEIFNDIKSVLLLPEESLKDLATTYGIGMKRLMRYNDISDYAMLHPGDRVYLQPKRLNGDDEFHTVRQGESMFSISRDHGVQMDELYKKNQMLLGKQPAIGEVLNLKNSRDNPVVIAEATDAMVSFNAEADLKIGTPELYIVSKGDTLYSISKKYNLSVEVLKTMNRMKTTSLQIGDKLVVSQ